MKALVKILASCLFVGAIFFLSGFASSTDNNGAFVDKDFGCGLMDGYGGFHFVTDGTISIVNSAGNTTLICKAKGLPTPGTAVVTEGFACGTYLGLTYDSQNVVSASGNVTLRCQVKANN